MRVCTRARLGAAPCPYPSRLQDHRPGALCLAHWNEGKFEFGEVAVLPPSVLTPVQRWAMSPPRIPHLYSVPSSGIHERTHGRCDRSKPQMKVRKVLRILKGSGPDHHAEWVISVA